MFDKGIQYGSVLFCRTAIILIFIQHRRTYGRNNIALFLNVFYFFLLNQKWKMIVLRVCVKGAINQWPWLIEPCFLYLFVQAKQVMEIYLRNGALYLAMKSWNLITRTMYSLFSLTAVTKEQVELTIILFFCSCTVHASSFAVTSLR